LALSIIFFVYKKYIQSSPSHQIKVIIFKTDVGWGYNIAADDSVLIHQNIIPGISGNKGFASQSDAAKVGNLVLYKIKNNQLPSVSIRELDSLQIVQ
jgi:hypothetical protein